MSPLRIALLHLWRRRLSSLIALIGIAIAVGSSGVLLRLYHLSAARFDSLPRAGDAIVGAKSSNIDILLGSLNLEGEYPDFIPLNLFMTLKSGAQVQFEDGATSRTSFVEAVIPFVIFATVADFRVISTEESFVFSRKEGLPELSSGRWATGKNEVVIGSQVRQQLQTSEEQTLSGQTWTSKDHSATQRIDFKVVGVLKETGKAWDRGIFSNLATAEEVLSQSPLSSIWKNHVLHYFLVYLHPAGKPWLESLINQRTVGQVAFTKEAFAQLEKLAGTGRDLGLIMSLVILLLGAFTVTAVMVTRFESMTAQLAVLRALGYSRWQLTGVMLTEALLLGVLACLLGASIDANIFPWIRELLGANLPAAEIVSMPLWKSAPVWGAALLGTLLSVIVPLWRLFRQDLHLSLRNL